MGVVRIRHMSVSVIAGLMGVRMAMRILGHRIMSVLMMTVIVRMGVFMRQQFVLVVMLVRLGQVQRYARHHQRATQH